MLSCLSLDFFSFGGGKRTRTADILLAKQALYQLSYTPSFFLRTSLSIRHVFFSMTISDLSPFEDVASYEFFSRWAILDSNQGPHPYQGCALTT
jgi:hypothetical protein